tara:strand:+ start:597 stop:1283 length:687 start_codon:yes stop_codon:yes gene_type:complete
MVRKNSQDNLTDIACVIHQAILNPHLDKEKVIQICDASKQYGFSGLCTSLSHLPVARERLGNKNHTKLITVIAFPFGFIPTTHKVNEAEFAIEHGAEELDLVPNYFALKEGNNELFAEEINQISELGIPVRVILDVNGIFKTQSLSSAINASIDAGAQGIQIGNGFGLAITSSQIKQLSEMVKNRCSIKAVGGIKTIDNVMKLTESGSTYIGTSFGFEIIQEQMKKEK